MRPASIPPSSSSSSSMATPLIGSEIDQHIKVLHSPDKRDDEKLNSVKEIWTSFEVLSASPTYSQSLENLMRVFLRVLTESAPQFVTDNDTQKLRKHILEIMLRTSTHEAMKPLIKELTKTLLRLLTSDNEENAILAVKVLIDVWKSAKVQFIPEVVSQVSSAAAFCKKMLKEMNFHVNGGMFETKEFNHSRSGPGMDDSIIESFLPHCYATQTVTINRGPQETKYTLIPRAEQSVKLIQELTMFFVFIYQHLKSSLVNECVDFLVICLEFVSLQVPAEAKESPSFNRALADEFYTSQSKVLCFISIMGKIQQFMDVIMKHSNSLITALLTLLESVPPDMVSVRKEVLMTLKFCCTTDLRNHMMRFLPKFLDESILLGTGFTAHDHLRAFIYQMLADLLHHMRAKLTFPLIVQTVAVFCRTMNDPNITYQVQVMCIRLLSSVCEALPNMEAEGVATRDLLTQVLDNLIYKLVRIATYHLPALIKVYGLESDLREKKEASPVSQESKSDVFDEFARKGVFDFSPSPSSSSGSQDGKEDASKSEEGFLPVPQPKGKVTPPEQMLTALYAVNSPAMTVIEARNMVKYILLTVKVVCTQLVGTNRSNRSISKEKERDLFENLLKYGVIVMDVYQLPYPTRGSAPLPVPQRPKEEKEIIDGFAQVFTSMNPDVYREIFSKHMPLLIERIHNNPTLQLFANAFLVRADWVCKFGSIMLKYLMDHMHVLSVSNEKTALYVKLFKIIFSAIGAGQQSATQDGELMLKPYLGDLIRKSTEYALTAREPLNYFLLLRALFRSIGGGAHDILYGHFLPLLPNLLQFLNKLQSCNHRQQMRELFLELCLTVPVRLSSLLPYLPLLMDPLVCALTGSASLVQQGLRTLELCVDNLQPEYLFDNMAPVRSALIQGLWKVLSTSADPSSAQTAFRILGKFGGASRRIMNKPQALTSQSETDWSQALLRLEFQRDHPTAPVQYADLSLSEIMALAVEQMKLCTTPGETSSNMSSLLPVQFVNHTTPQMAIIRENCIALAKGVFLTSLYPNAGDDWRSNVVDSLRDNLKKLEQCPGAVPLYRCPRESDRKMYVNALVVIMMGVMGKDLRPSYVNFFTAIVRQLTINALLESASFETFLSHPYLPLCLDGAVLVDAIVTVLSDSNKDFLSSAIVALCHINETCETLSTTGGSFHETPLIRHLVESVSALCYGPSWFSRLGGASALSYMIRNYPMTVIRANLRRILDSLCEVIVGLVDEISSGAVDLAVSSLSALQKRLFEKYDAIQDPDSRLPVFLSVYLPFTCHSSAFVRDRAWELLSALSEITSIPLQEMFSKNADIFAAKIDQIVTQAHAMSMNEQDASLATLLRLMDETPSVVKLNIHEMKYEKFLGNVLYLCETEVPDLIARDFYRSTETCPVHFLPPFPIPYQMESMRTVAIQTMIMSVKVLSSDPEMNTNIEIFTLRVFTVALKAAMNGTPRQKEAVHKTLVKCAPLPIKLVREVGSSTLSNLEVAWSSPDVIMLEKLYQLNPDVFSPQLATKLVTEVGKWKAVHGSPRREPDDVDALKALIRLLLVSNQADSITCKRFVSFIGFFESTFVSDTPYDWDDLLCELVCRYPADLLGHVLSLNFLKTYENLVCRILSHEKAAPFRKALISDSAYFDNLLQMKTLENGSWVDAKLNGDDEHIAHEDIVMRLLDTVAEKELEWFQEAHGLIEQLRNTWTSETFINRYSIGQQYVEKDGLKMVKVTTVQTAKAYVPTRFVYCFMRYFKKNYENYELIFDMMSAFNNIFITDFGFLRDYVEQEVIPRFSLEWRRRLFEIILERFEGEPSLYCNSNTMSRTVQYVVIPVLQYAFERFDVDEILGPKLLATDGQEEDPNSLIARFTVVLEKHRAAFNDRNSIALYQLCILFVEHANEHIHNNNCKKQGGRLRVFMLFVWSVLTPATHMDPTLRYQGYLFLAHIIDRFTINRKIVLQVFTTLASSYQLDNRDLVKRAVDVLIPAVPVRMDDGHQQMLIVVKKILVEESHNLQQIQHIVHMVIRNYRVFFYVRHELISPLINAIQRILHSVNGVVEGFTARKLTLEVCEMAIKWDLLRNQMLEQTSQLPESEVECVLETLKELEQKDSSSSGGPIGASRIENSMAAINAARDDKQMQPLGKEFVDQIVNILLKFACMIPMQNQPSQYATSTMDMGKKSQGLLRAALKPVVWGETVTIRASWIEKQLTISQDYANVRGEQQVLANQNLNQALQTLDVIYTLSAVMPKSLILTLMRPLQRPLISCLNTTFASNGPHYLQLVRLVNYMVARLFEKTKSSSQGLEELEIFNQYINKFLSEHFQNFIKSNSAHVTQIFTAFSLLRSICGHEPSYLDSVIPTFIRVLEKVARDHHLTPGDQREKTVADFLSVAIDLIRPRVNNMTTDNRRQLCANVLIPLVEKTNYDKIIESLLKIAAEILAGEQPCTTNPGLPLAVRLHSLMERKLSRNPKDHHSSALLPSYLAMVLMIFEKPVYRASEYSKDVEDGFYWGLMSPDSETREKFLAAWEMNIEPNAFKRMMYILQKEDWSHFGKYYWIRHALWLCLRCCMKKDGQLIPSRSVYFNDCATLWRTLEITTGSIPSLGAMNLNSEVISSESTPSRPEPEAMEVDGDPFEQLVAAQRTLLNEAQEYDSTNMIRNIMNLVFNVQDTKFVSGMWNRFFISMWGHMLPEERVICGDALQPFMSSGIHNKHMNAPQSALGTWLETLNHMMPSIHIEARLVEFIAKNHMSWHRGVLMLESQVLSMNGRMLNNDSAAQMKVDKHTQLHLDTLDYLASLYKDLNELDQFAAIWDRRAIRPETLNVMHHVQRGDWSDALSCVEDSLLAIGEQMNVAGSDARIGPALDYEYDHLWGIFETCCHELMQWEKLRDYANSQAVQSPATIMSAAIHIPDWDLARECRDQISGCVPPEFTNKFNVISLMLMIMQSRDPNDPLAVVSKQRMEKTVEEMVLSHISWWRSLPSIISHAHVKVLQSMSLIREVADCVELKASLDSNPREYNHVILNEMKSLYKTWRGRVGTTSDDLSFITTVNDWRNQVHLLMLRRFDEWEKNGINIPAGTTAQAILPVHSAAQGQLNVAKVCRNMRLYDLSIDQLNRLHTLNAVPTMDAHLKICEHMKILRLMSEAAGAAGDDQERIAYLTTGIHLMNETRIDDFGREQVAKLYCHRGVMLGALGKREEAKQAFSIATTATDGAMTSPTNVFKCWGNHMDRMLEMDSNALSGITYGAGAMAAFLEVARSNDTEHKPKKYIGKLLWTAKHLVAVGGDSCTRLDDQIDKHERTTVSFNWLSWLPQLVNEIRCRPDSSFVKILARITEDYPLQVFYTLRSAIGADIISAVINEECMMDRSPKLEDVEPWVRNVIPVLRTACRLRSADVRVFHSLLEEMYNMREFWSERMFRYGSQMKREIARCLTANRHLPITQMQMDAEALQMWNVWRTDIQDELPRLNLLRESELIYLANEQRPMISEEQFIANLMPEIVQFLSAPPAPGLLLPALSSVTMICNRLSGRLGMLPKRIPLKLSSQYLADFSHRLACIEMPSDLLEVHKANATHVVAGSRVGPSQLQMVTLQFQSGQYVSMIARIDPYVALSFEGGELVRRMHFRAHSGKSAGFYLRRTINPKVGVTWCQQYLSSLNHLLSKERETARRHLAIYVPTQLKVGYGCTLTEVQGVVVGENPSGLATRSPMIHPYEMLSCALSPVGMQPDDAMLLFYERIYDQNFNGAPEMRLQVYREFCVEEFISTSILLRYLGRSFTDPTMFYMLRKQIARHMAVLNTVEYLTKLSPVAVGDMYINRTTGQYTNPNYAFTPADSPERPVPYRMTPNIAVLLGFSQAGDFQWCADATARCLFYRRPEAFLRPLIWDYTAQVNVGMGYRDIFAIADRHVKKVTADTKELAFTPTPNILGQQLDSAALLMLSRQDERICLMDPAQYPWF